MIGDQAPHNVLLPRKIWEEAKDKEHFKQLVLQYMRRYPDYTVKSVKNGFAVCEKRGFHAEKVFKERRRIEP